MTYSCSIKIDRPNLSPLLFINVDSTEAAVKEWDDTPAQVCHISEENV